MGQQARRRRSTFFFLCITLVKPSFQARPRPARARGTDGLFMLAAFPPLAQSSAQNT